MKVLSLFDGISCGYLALRRAGIPIDTYYASEIDKTCSGKGKGFMDARGRLFFCFSDIVKHLRKETKGKVLFLGENVRDAG